MFTPKYLFCVQLKCVYITVCTFILYFEVKLNYSPKNTISSHTSFKIRVSFKQQQPKENSFGVPFSKNVKE